jgi:hypothetical protein
MVSFFFPRARDRHDEYKMSTEGVRKTAFGRTSLFINMSDQTNVSCVRTSSNAMKRVDGAVYHNLSDAAKQTDCISCWHCCEPIQGQHFCIPKSYDANEQLYYVYGHFDTLSCCKGFVLEQARFDKGQQMNILMQMIRDVYGVYDEIVEAPPRTSLQRFGGPFSMEEFLRAPRVVRPLEPPFVSYCMLAEEHPSRQAAAPDTSSGGTIMAMVDDDAFSEPPPLALYDSFVAGGAPTPTTETAQEDDSRATGTTTNKRGRTAKSTGSSLARFCKKK